MTRISMKVTYLNLHSNIPSDQELKCYNGQNIFHDYQMPSIATHSKYPHFEIFSKMLEFIPNMIVMHYTTHHGTSTKFEKGPIWS